MYQCQLPEVIRNIISIKIQLLLVNQLINQYKFMNWEKIFKGIIRINDIRSTERDKLKLIDCFKPGDIVKAQVISLGDGSNYYLTTAKMS